MNQSKGLALSQSKGFTIIELIVVIAIIAILAATVLVSMSGYINKAKDSSMKQEVHNLLIDATSLAFSTASSNYSDAVSTVCSTTNKNYKAISETAGTGNYTCGTNGTIVAGEPAGTNFCFCFKELSPSTATYYCQDSSGVTTETSTACDSNCIVDSTSKKALCGGL